MKSGTRAADFRIKPAVKFPSPLSPHTAANGIHRSAREPFAAGACLPTPEEARALAPRPRKRGVVVRVRRERCAPRPPPPLGEARACPWPHLAAVPRAAVSLALLQALGFVGGLLNLLLPRSACPLCLLDACTVMSYNILADYNARNHPDLYWDVPWDAMRWDSRRRLIVREIRHWDPDFVCLQEVDRFRDIAAEMKNRGYEGIFQGRTGDARDGCATFWKSKRLRLLEEDSIDFSEFNLRNNVAQICVFELNGKQKLVLGNIHVLFNPKRGDIKLGQIRMLLEKANTLAEKWDEIPIVLAGDFNSTPDSAIYKFLSTMKLNISLHDRRLLSGLDSSELGLYELCSLFKYQWSDEEVRNATGYSNVMVAEHPLNLCSSYAMLKGNSNNRGLHGEPLATSFHKKFLGTVDYLWYTPGLECSRVLDTLPIGVLRRTRGLPTREIGSDHLPLVAEFTFTESVDDESEKEYESEQDHECEQEVSTAQHIYFSDSDSG
ncbi:carbon catabolite repressor protein 4 homolog 3-like isoform X1 [Phragmites australis]|uniref:carbon catabolite repressor protein 4 homolog 3-like isoform X1 n=1 Tax=Phragmites australis TaxID=29695 RepID=UPI002D792632|nr:carbon catabolite repressor protein 4 homolog 3-like isoform X1 [Phragmites australis]